MPWLARPMSRAAKNGLDHMPVYVSQSAFDAIVIERQAFVIQTEQMQQGGVQVVDGANVFDGAMAVLIGGAVAESFLDAGAGQPHREAMRIVIAPLSTALERGHAAELGHP